MSQQTTTTQQHLPCGQCEQNGWMDWREEMRKLASETSRETREMRADFVKYQIEAQRARSECQQKNTERLVKLESDVAGIKKFASLAAGMIGGAVALFMQILGIGSK